MSHHRDTQQSLLSQIATNTKNVNLNVDSLEVNTDQLETIMTSVDTRLSESIGHPNNSTGIGDGSNQLRNVPLGYDRTAGQVRSFLVDSAGHQQVDLVSGGDITSKLDTFAGAGNNNVGEGSSKLQIFNYGRDVSAGNFKPMVVNSSAEQIVALSAIDNQVLDNISAHTGTVDGCVASNKMNVNISSMSGGGLATETTLSAAEVHLGNVETKLGTIETDIEATNTALSTIDSVLDNAEAHLGNIDTGVDVLEACVGSNKVNVNISSGNITGFATATLQGAGLPSALSSNNLRVSIQEGNITGFATETTLSAAEVHLGNVETKLGTIETDIEATNTALSTIDSVLDNAEAHLGNIDTGVDVLEACVGSNKVNVNISSGNISGFSTATLQGTTNGKLDVLESSLTAIESDIEATNTALGTIDGVLDNAEAHLGNIDTGIDVLEACVGSNKVNVNISSGNISGFATSTLQGAGLPSALSSDNLKVSIQEGNISGFSTATLQGTTNGKLDVLESSLTAIESDIEATNTALGTIDGVLDNAEAHLGNIETAVQLLDNAVDGNFLNVNLNLAGADVANNSGNKSNTCPRVVIATDDVNISAIKATHDITTTTIHNNVSIGGSASDTSSTVISFTHYPRSITILAGDFTSSQSIAGNQVSISPLVSFDNSTYFDLSTFTSSGAQVHLTSGDALFQKCVVIENARFPFMKIKLTNGASGSINFHSVVSF